MLSVALGKLKVSMPQFTTAITALWVAFSLFWLISAIGVRKNIRKRTFWQRSGERLLLIALVILLFESRSVRHLFRRHWISASNPVVGTVSVAICVLGLALAVWARLHLGKNWGQPMSLKEGHELITTGPYRYVRHPIYTGILLAMLGSSLVEGSFWLAAFILFGIYFVYSARIEDRLMMEQFPNEYPKYRCRTKGLVPGIW